MRFAKVVYVDVISTKYHIFFLLLNQQLLVKFAGVRKRDAKNTWLNNMLTGRSEKSFVIMSIIVALLAFLATKIFNIILIPNPGTSTTTIITTVTITSTTTATIGSTTTATITSTTTAVWEPIFIRYGDTIDLKYSSLEVWRYLTTNFMYKY
ncbi:hypothetical protein BC938DRAFT_475043, partial [Jimgerdemannia flammicorona]